MLPSRLAFPLPICPFSWRDRNGSLCHSLLYYTTLQLPPFPLWESGVRRSRRLLPASSMQAALSGSFSFTTNVRTSLHSTSADTNRATSIFPELLWLDPAAWRIARRRWRRRRDVSSCEAAVVVGSDRADRAHGVVVAVAVVRSSQTQHAKSKLDGELLLPREGR